MRDMITELFEEMEVEKASFLKHLESLSEEELKRTSYGRWVPLQVLEHVIISETGTLGYLKKKTRARADEIEKAGLEEARSAQILVNDLMSTSKWSAPKVMPEPEGLKSISELSESWAKLRASFKEFLSELPEAYFNKQVFNHPISGRMDLYYTLRFISAHIHHHQEQLDRISKAG